MGPKVIFDTNILISALGWGGTPLAVVQMIDSVTLLLSEEILAEYATVLRYD